VRAEQIVHIEESVTGLGWVECEWDVRAGINRKIVCVCVCVCGGLSGC